MVAALERKENKPVARNKESVRIGVATNPTGPKMLSDIRRAARVTVIVNTHTQTHTHTHTQRRALL